MGLNNHVSYILFNMLYVSVSIYLLFIFSFFFKLDSEQCIIRCPAGALIKRSVTNMVNGLSGKAEEN